MIIPRKKGESEEEYLSRVEMLQKAAGFGKAPAGWPKPVPIKEEQEQEDSDA